MKTKDDVRFDLREIRFYYANQIEFDIATKAIGANTVIKKVAEYNQAVASAPARLYLLYYNLYINGKTQFSYADEIDKSWRWIYRLNVALYEYLLSYFNSETYT